MSRSPRITFVIPAFGEEANLDSLLTRVLAQSGLGSAMEVIVVDDHSTDGTFGVVRRWAALDPRVCGIRLSRNSGSHMAILSGLSIASGDVVIVLAGDGQDPPEFARELLEAWSAGAQIVWATRQVREGETWATRLLSRLYYATMNRGSDVRLPPTGADFFLLDRRVVEVLRRIPERNTSILALITWLGFRQQELPYVKDSRPAGRSKWTLRKKVRLALDSFFSFSVLPLRMATGLGFLTAVAGFFYAALLFTNKVTGGLLFRGVAVEGWSALMVVLLMTTGTILVVVGVLGEYLWRTLEEVRQRPRFAIEDAVNIEEERIFP